MDIREFRQKYPQYNDFSDQQVADRLYDRHYSDMLRSEFDAKFGVLKTPQDLQPSNPMEQPQPAAYRPPAGQQGGLAGLVLKDAGVKPQPSGQMQGKDWWTGLAGQVAQGTTLGFADEAIAGLYAGLGVNNYDENLRRIRGVDKQFVNENPVTSFAANVAGGLPVGGAIAKGGQGLLSMVAPNAARAVGAGTASVGQRIAAGGATGVGAGAVAGFGSGEGGVENRATNAGIGGLLGGSLGSAFPVVTSAASGAGNAALRAMPWLRDINVAGMRPFTSADDRATQIIGQTMARGGDQGAAEQALSGAVKSQITKPTGAVSDTVLGDVSPELRSLTGAVLRSPGAGAAKAREFVATRQEGIPLANVPGQGSRLAGEVSNVGGKINLRDTLDTIVEQRSAAAKPLFEKAFQVGDVVNPTLANVAQDGAIQRALAKGVVLGKRAGDIPQDFKLLLKDPSQPIAARVWHYAKTALDDQISTLRQAGKGAEARSAQILKTNLINGLDEATGGNYRPALADFAGRSALLDAAEQGQKAVSSGIGPDDIQRTLAGFQTQGEKDLFAQAYKSVLANSMANSSRTTNAANKALLTDQQVAKIRSVFPPDQAEEIIRRASVRDAQFRTYAETKGSQTQARQMAEQDIEGSIQSGLNAAGAVSNPKGYIIGRAIEWLSTMPGRAMSEKVRNALAKQLVDPDPKKVANALQAVQAAAERSVKQTRTITGNRQFIGQAAGQTAANNTLNPGLSGLAEMYSGAWDKGDAIDRFTMAAAPVPVVGDIASVANDTRHYASGSLPLTWQNLALTGLGATALGVGAFAPKSMIMPDPNSFGMFGGNLAAKADKAKMQEAAQAIESGAKAEDVWKRTGWYQGVDGKLRFEIDDSAAKLNVPKTEGEHALGDVLDHKQLFENYPAMRDTKIVFAGGMKPNELGSFDPTTGVITVNAKMPVKNQLSTILHEIQHNIQKTEGFAPGGNPITAGMTIPDDVRAGLDSQGIPNDLAFSFYEAAYESLRKAEKNGMSRADWEKQNPTLAKMMTVDPKVIPGRRATNEEFFRRYKQIAGEAEARNTQARAGMTAAERAQSFPDSTMDVPRNEQFRLPDDPFIGTKEGVATVNITKYTDTLKTLPGGTGVANGPQGRAIFTISDGRLGSKEVRVAVASGSEIDEDAYRKLAQVYAADRGVRVRDWDVTIGRVTGKNIMAGLDKASQFAKLVASERRKISAKNTVLPAATGVAAIAAGRFMAQAASQREPKKEQKPRKFGLLNMSGAYD